MPAAARPFIFVLAGVKGAGKSSVGGAMLADHGLTWFNLDAYARELTVQFDLPLAQANSQAWQHGKYLLEAALADGTNHAFETTLGGRTIADLLAQATLTHRIVMLFCGLSSPEQHLARVALRVAHGGHPIAEQKIRERWVASRVNLIKLLPVLAHLQVLDNSAEALSGHDIPDPVLVLEMTDGRMVFPARDDATALAATPQWARPIVQAAIEGPPRSARSGRVHANRKQIFSVRHPAPIRPRQAFTLRHLFVAPPFSKARCFMRLIRSRFAALVWLAVSGTSLGLWPSAAEAQSAMTSGGGGGGGGGGMGGGMGAAGGGSAGSMAPSASGLGPATAPTTPGVPTITNGPADLLNPQQGNGDRATQEVKADGGGTVRQPLVPNEFQRFVYNATGQALPLFGQRYFDEAERTFAPTDRIPVPADYVLGPGDELYIRAWGAIDVDYRATVDRNGQISLPRVGSIGVAGLKANEVQGHLQSQIGRLYKNFSLNVTLGQLRSIQVFVVGQARRPGSYTVSSLSTLVNVVFASGGPGANGSLRSVQLKRGDRVVAELDLYDFITNGNKGQDARLQPGDVIVFIPAGPRAALIGALDAPAIYELKPGGETIASVLAYGGGTNAATNMQNAQLERIDASNPRAPRTVNKVELAGAIGNMKLRDGDVLTLFSVAPQFANAVTLRGNVAAPLRYPYMPGMRVSDLIPDKDALITPDYYVRKNKLVQFTESRDVNTATVAHDMKNIVDEPNWEYAAVERLDPNTLTMQLLPFNLGKVVLEHDKGNDLLLQPGDVVTIFAKNDIRNPVARQTRLVRVEGEVAAPGIYQVAPADTLQSLIARAGGLTPEAYVYGTEFAREETRQKQQIALDDAVKRLEVELANAGATQAANLSATNAQSADQLQAAQLAASRAQLSRLKSMKASGRISLELDPRAESAQALPDLRLEDGDRLLVPPRPAYVFAVGAVANNNALLWKPNRKLADYLDSAGVNAEADMENMFVVRADGSIVHSNRRGLFSGIEKVVLMPGDSVVVPGKTNRETFWTAFVRGLKDWSQILYQFGLTAAAIQTLRN
ncbi:MAG: SLBB domain-containing protein [Burkholderiales bacterium]